jgi:cell shape-determining protein MreC
LLFFYAVPKVVSGIGALVFMPVHKIESWIAHSSDAFPQFFRDRTTLLEELNGYKYSQSSQSGDRYTAELLSKENETLRALLDDDGGTRVLAGVIGRPGVVPYDVLVLDKGSDAGIVVGAPVFIGENAIIGVVEKVFSDSSVVMLVTTPDFVSSVYIMGPNIYTNAVGVGGGFMKIGVPQGIPLAVGDLVILPGVQSGIYGEIHHVESVPTQPEQYAFVSPEVPIASLRLVGVGKSPITPVSFEEAQQIVADNIANNLTVAIPEGVLVTLNATSASSSATSTKNATTTP